jgi:hypothetical protein
MAGKKTRNSSRDTFLGYSSAYSLALGTKLPLKGAVLKRLLHIPQKNDLLPTREMCSSEFLDELNPIWSRAGIPIKADKKCIDMTNELWESFLKLKQVPKSRRDKKVIDFQGIQNSLFDLSPINVKSLMQSTRSDVWEEDYKFLEMQRLYPQQGSMGVVDVVTYNRERKKNGPKIRWKK